MEVNLKLKSKNTCEVYNIAVNNHDMVSITLDESKGLFQAHGAYGSYSHMWTSIGDKTLKEFLISICRDKHYLGTKLSDRNYFHAEQTKSNWKNIILESRRGTSIDAVELTREEARELYDFINNIDYSCEFTCYNELVSNSLINEKFIDPWWVFETHMGLSPCEEFFIYHIMPAFGELLKKELNGEKLTII